MEQQLAFLPVKIFIVKNSGQCLSAYLYKSYWIIEYLLLHLSLISQICKEHIISLYIVSGLIWQYSIGKRPAAVPLLLVLRFGNLRRIRRKFHVR